MGGFGTPIFSKNNVNSMGKGSAEPFHYYHLTYKAPPLLWASDAPGYSHAYVNFIQWSTILIIHYIVLIWSLVKLKLLFLAIDFPISLKNSAFFSWISLLEERLCQANQVLCSKSKRQRLKTSCNYKMR